jgi:hypothetical protein
MRNPFAARPLTRGRIALAIAIAGATDALQIGLGPLGWTFVDEVADVAAMILISLLIGFHPLLLPTFVLEAFPLVDMLPTWTGCVGAVILWRRNMKSQTDTRAMDEASAPTPEARQHAKEAEGPIIDV